MKSQDWNANNFTITTTRQVQAHLQALLPFGLYGNTVAEVAERLICEGLRTDLKRSRQRTLEQQQTL